MTKKAEVKKEITEPVAVKTVIENVLNGYILYVNAQKCTEITPVDGKYVFNTIDALSAFLKAIYIEELGNYE